MTLQEEITLIETLAFLNESTYFNFIKSTWYPSGNAFM